MAGRRVVTMDGNEAVASVAYRINEVAAIYPITPSSNMGEWADEWSAKGQKNIWGTVPSVAEMQSEGGAAGAVHGALQAGALTTTFTASQGLLLMIPNMYKIAGELTAFCMHVSARTLATHALSIFGDHQDVMGVRQTGFALLSSASVQEAHDFAVIAQLASMRSRVPFLHFFDGFRTSHEVAKIEELTDDDLRALIPEELVAAHRARALSPDAPSVRGTAQNPDAFFQAREACNPFYADAHDHVQAAMDEFAKVVGRKYGLFEYHGHPEAERVIVLMGSGCETAQETIDHLVAQGEKVGMVKVRLYRPFALGEFMTALPRSVHHLAVLDRTKEPGALGEPLYMDVVTALREAEQAHIDRFHHQLTVIGGRYGLSSKEFTPAMVKAVFDELAKPRPKRHFTVGINDDVTHLSLKYDPTFDIEGPSVVRALFYGLGADGTVGANKNSIKIIGEDTPNYAQGYFVYDSKKSGSITVSHLRFGPKPIRSAYLVTKANFVACHQFGFLEKYEMVEFAVPGATFLLNSIYGPDQVWEQLPREVQEQILQKQLKFYVIDAFKVARETGMGVRINTVMQTCFFAVSGVLPRDEAIEPHQEDHREDLPAQGRRRGPQELRGGRPDPGQPPRGEDRRPTGQRQAPPARRLRGGAGLRPARHLADAGRQGRPAAGLGLPGRRHLAHRHLPVGEALHRPRHPDLGAEPLHPVQQVRAHLPARLHPAQVLRGGGAGRRARHLQVDGLQVADRQGEEVHHPGGAGRLHRLHALRGDLPGRVEDREGEEGAQHGRGAAAQGGRAAELGLLPRPSPTPTGAPSSSTSRGRSSSSRSSSSPAPAPAAARPRTSSC